jgi:hypothetical protein
MEHFFMNILCTESFGPQEMHNRTLIFSNTLFKHGHHFYYWNQPVNMPMLVYYLDCNEAELSCNIVIHFEKPLRPLQLFYFHLSPIYWLPVETNL